MSSLSRRSEIEPFHAMDILAEGTRRRAAGRPVISLAVGQPAAPAPQKALEPPARRWKPGASAIPMRWARCRCAKAISRDYADRHGVAVDPARIAITTGSSAGFNLAFLALFDPGDAVAIARPGYPAYRNILTALGLRVVEVDAGAEHAFTLTPEGWRRRSRPRACG